MKQLLRLLPTLLLAFAIFPVATASADSGPDVGVDALFGMAGDTPCELEAVIGGVHCVVADEPVLEILHPALFPAPRQYRERTEGQPPVGPVELDGHYFYGVDNDLLRFDAQARQITQRVRFPAAIADIVVGDAGLDIKIDTTTFRSGAPTEVVDGESPTVTIEFEPGQEQNVGRGIWDWSGTLGPLHDAMWLDEIDMETEPGATEVESQATEEEERAAIAALKWRQNVDATNPYPSLYLGEALLRIGDDSGAAEAFDEAIEYEQAHWSDLVRIGLRLEYRGFSDHAERAIERAGDAMEEAGVRGEYMTAMVNVTFAFVWLQPVFAGAVASGDFETVDRVAGHVDHLFPKAEGAPMAWRRVGALLDDHGQQDRAEFWQDRAAEVAGADDRPDRLFEEATTAVDIYFVLQLGLLLSALLAGLILGLWRYDERDDEKTDDAATDETGDEEKPEWSQYLPRFYPVDLAILGGLFVVVLLTPALAAGPVQSMVTLAEAPAAASGDAVAAPAVGQWAQELSGGNELVQESQVELEATQAGGYGPGDANLNSLLIEAIENDTAARQINTLSAVEASEQTMQEFDWLWALTEFEFDTTTLLLMLLVLAMNALILGTLLQAVARRFDTVSKYGRRIVPGAPNSLRVLRLPVLTTFVVGLVMMTPIGRMVTGSLEATMATSFGLDTAPAALEMTMPQVGFALVVVALVFHAIGVVRDQRD